MANDERMGGGFLARNQHRKTDNQPEYTGVVTLEHDCPSCGHHDKVDNARVAAWVKTGDKGKYFSLAVSKPRPPQQQSRTQGTGRRGQGDDFDGGAY